MNVLNIKRITFKIEAFGKLFFLIRTDFRQGSWILTWFDIKIRHSSIVEIGLMISQEPISKSDTIPPTKKTTNYYDFKNSELNPNFSYINTDIIESGIV